MRKRMLLALAGALLLSACGDGSRDSSDGVQPSDEIITFGTVTRFGSVVANGMEFDSDAAAVTMNDQPANPAELRIGHVVAITATVRSQTRERIAHTIGCLDEVEGPVNSINTANNSFVVLGRTVFFDELTVFENLAWEGLAVGNVVRVMGHIRNQERIHATHIERIANAYGAGMHMSVKGQISGLDPGLSRFRIGTQSCDYSTAMLELGGADLANGLYVEVSSASPIADGVLKLDRIQARDRDRDRDRDHLCDGGCDFDLEGYITGFVSPAEFYVDGAAVTTTASTVYVHGTVESLATDVLVAVTGALNEAGVLVADKIVFRLPSIIQIEADAEAVDAVNGSVTLLGIEVAITSTTMFRDVSTAALREFWLDDIGIGDRLEIRAYLDGDTVVAARLERDDAETTVTLKAPVEAIARPGVTLLGVTVTADDDTVFQGADKTVIDEDGFFALVEIGSLVKSVGTYDGTSILADTLFLRECEGSCL